MEYLLSFFSSHNALKAESLFKAHGIKFRLLPAPKEITASCALVISVDKAVLEEALALLDDSGAKTERIYKREDKKYVKV